MYGYDRKFLQEVNQISATLLNQVLQHIRALDRPEVGGCTPEGAVLKACH